MVKMRTFAQNKLWRDKLPAQRKAFGSIIHVKELDDAEYDKQLRIKLLEEADEVACAKTERNLIEEVADLFEVVDALLALHKIDRTTLIAAQTEKRELLGGFSGRTFVIKADHPEGSDSEKYCLADPKKYPEIIE